MSTNVLKAPLRLQLVEVAVQFKQTERIYSNKTITYTPKAFAAIAVPSMRLLILAKAVSRDVDALTALWDEDAVLLQPGAPAITGKSAFRDFVKQSYAKSPSAKVLKYVPDFRDLRVAGHVAYE